MTPNPLWEEPGFRNEDSERNRNYNRLISHQNIRIGIIKMVNSPPDGFECFKNIFKYHLKTNMNTLLETCEARRIANVEIDDDENIGKKKTVKLEGQYFKSPNIFGFGCVINYTGLKEELENLSSVFEQQEDPYKLDTERVYDNLSTEFVSFKDTFMLVREFTELDPIELLTLLSIQNKIHRNVKGEIRKKQLTV
jgi:hypothetical protein